MSQDATTLAAQHARILIGLLLVILGVSGSAQARHDTLQSVAIDGQVFITFEEVDPLDTTVVGYEVYRTATQAANAVDLIASNDPVGTVRPGSSINSRLNVEAGTQTIVGSGCGDALDPYAVETEHFWIPDGNGATFNLAPAQTGDPLTGLFVYTRQSQASEGPYWYYVVTLRDIGGSIVEDQNPNEIPRTIGQAGFMETDGTPRPIKQYEDADIRNAQNVVQFDDVDLFVLWTGDLPLSDVFGSGRGYGAMDSVQSVPHNLGVRGDQNSTDWPLVLRLHARGRNETNCFTPAGSGMGVDDEVILAPEDWLPELRGACPDAADFTNSYWYGYHESLGVYDPVTHLPNCSPTPVTANNRNFTQRRVQFLLDWVENDQARHGISVDVARGTYALGTSMGAVGSLFLAEEAPERLAAVKTQLAKIDFSINDDPNNDDVQALKDACTHLADHNNLDTFNFEPGGSERDYVDVLWGPVEIGGVETRDQYFAEDGTTWIYDRLNAGFLTSQNSTDRPVTLAVFGKCDEVVQWYGKPAFLAAREAERLGGIFFWDLGGHGDSRGSCSSPDQTWDAIYACNAPTDGISHIAVHRKDQSYPAFSAFVAGGISELSRAGDGHVHCVGINPPCETGDDFGTLSGLLTWVAGSIVDTPTKYQLTVNLDDLAGAHGAVVSAPSSATVDMTLRRVQSFPTDNPAGYRVKVLRQFGAYLFDLATPADGLLTIPLSLGKGDNQVTITPL